MKRPPLIGFVILLVGAGLPTLAGEYFEDFSDHSMLDPTVTTAHWNIVDGRLELPKVEQYQDYRLFDLSPTQDGGAAALLVRSDFGSWMLYLQRFDGQGSLLWEVPVVTDISGLHGARVTTASDGDTVVLYQLYSALEEVLLERYDPDGTARWPSPIQVNQGSGSVGVGIGMAAALPGGDVVVAWTDNRDGVNNLPFAQRVDPAGTALWGAGDLSIAPTLGQDCSGVVVDTDSTGRTFVAWTTYSGGEDLYLSRLDPTGSVLWDPPIQGPVDGSGNEEHPRLAVVEGQGVFLAWEEWSTESTIKMIRRNWSGLAVWPADLVIRTSPDHIDELDLAEMADGNLLVGYILGDGDDSQAYSHWVPASGAHAGVHFPLHDQYGIHESDEVLVEGLADGAGMSLVHRRSTFGSFIQLQRLQNTGQPFWDQPRRLFGDAGPPLRLDPRFIHGSGSGGGFEVCWTEDRDHSLHPFTREFQDPVTRLGDYDRRVGSNPEISGFCRAARAPDGTTAMIWVQAQLGEAALMAQWYDANWTPLLGSDLVIEPQVRLEGPPTSELVVTSTGMAMVTWTGEIGSETGIWLQGFSRTADLAFVDAFTIDDAPPGTEFQSVDLDILPDDSLVFTWLDDRDGDGKIRAQRVNPAGTRQWATDLEVCELLLPQQFECQVVTLGSQIEVIFTAGDPTSATVFRRSIGADGIPVSSSFTISGAHDSIQELAACEFEGDVAAIYVGYDLDSSVMVLRNGAGPAWADVAVNATEFWFTQGLDLIRTGPDSMAAAYSLVGSEGFEVHLQELDGAGALAYGADQPLVDPEPVYIGAAVAGSAPLGTGDPVYCAVLYTSDDESGGILNYFLSNDGSAQWHPVRWGFPIVFPSAGSDIRWGVDLYCHPDRQTSPSVQEVEVVWDLGPGMDLILNQSVFRAGDPFRLELRMSNPGAPQAVEEYIILAVAGDYWFWPGWTQEPDNRTRTLPPGLTTETILEFTWPTGAGAMSDLAFFSGGVEPGTADVLTPIDMEMFSFQ